MKKITTLTFSVLASAMLLTGCNTNTKETAAASISVTEQSTAEQK